MVIGREISVLQNWGWKESKKGGKERGRWKGRLKKRKGALSGKGFMERGDKEEKNEEKEKRKAFRGYLRHVRE